MTESDTREIARVFGGEVWNSGGDINLVVLERSDGRVVAISDEVICEYANREELETGQPLNSITLV